MPSNDLVQSWLQKGAHDLETAKIVASHLPDYDDVIVFHCQQTLEKVDRISRYAVQIRYPDTIIKLTKFQIQEAIKMADLVFTLVNGKIS